jgi:small subunit ribosomal protein S8e
MARTQHRSTRKASGGRYHPARGKRKQELAGFAAVTKLGDTKAKSIRVVGGNSKSKLLSSNVVNVAEKGKTKKTEILNVLENPANPHLVRRNIMTKGSIVETKLGKVKLTSRPGQEGTLHGVLI